MNSSPFPFSDQPEPTPRRHLPGHSRPGDGTRLTSNAIGQSTGAQGGGQTFNHPWRPFLSAGKLIFNRGTVQSFSGEGPIEPTINGIPMSGKNGTTPTPLDLKGADAKDGVSWAVLVVHPNDQGELMHDSKCEIMHSSNANADHALTFGRTAIAMILWSKGTPVRALPIVHFNLRYARVVPPAGGGAPQHRFL